MPQPDKVQRPRYVIYVGNRVRAWFPDRETAEYTLGIYREVCPHIDYSLRKEGTA